MSSSISCTDCKGKIDSGAQHRCPTCGGTLDLHMDRSFPREKIITRPTSMWRYREAIPAFEKNTSLGEQMTPLVPISTHGLNLLLKCEYTLPPGSYKDRGAATLVSHLHSHGIVEAVEDSSGTAGASIAAYCARSGINLKVFCPETASPGKLTQIALYGGELIKVPGPRSQATEALLQYMKNSDCAYASHLWHPLFLEGIRTMAYEIWEQLEWSAPDYVVCPAGAGSILLGLFDGFSDLLKKGLIGQLPKLVAVQAENVSAICAAFHGNYKEIKPIVNPLPTIAEGIAMPAPVRGPQVLHAIKISGGTAITVDEEEIATGVTALGSAGFCVEPTSAVVWEGVRKLTAESELPFGTNVVAILSGHGLKASSGLSAILKSKS